jgi:hypothetical protein
LTENEEIRHRFAKHIFENYQKYKETPVLNDYSFYPIKEMLVEILTVADEKKDFKSGFKIVLCTQRFMLRSAEGTEAKHLGEYFYTQPIIRNRGFWSAAINTYRDVGVYLIRYTILVI